jgi:hypothetical protein
MKLRRPQGTVKSKLDKYLPEIKAFLANGFSQRFIAERYASSEAKLSHWLRKHGIKYTILIAVSNSGPLDQGLVAIPMLH